MKRLALFFCILLSGWCLSAADSVLPSPLPQARYEALRKKSPFAPATAAPTPAVAAPGFAIDWFVSALAKIGDRDFVTIQSRDGQKRFSLFAGETGLDGITVNTIEWAPDITKSKVVVKKGTELASLEFDQAAATRIAPALTMPNVPGQPGAMPLRGPTMPGRPRAFDVRGQTGTAQPLPQPVQPDQRRRIRIINSPQQPQ
jgi:hypothetical protein